MKRITLDIDEKVLSNFRTRVMIRGMNGENDALVAGWFKIIEAVDKGQETVELKFKKDMD